MVKHSPIGASSASRWFPCPGSPALIAKAPKQQPSKYADQGSGAHWVLEECLGTDKDPWDYVGVQFPDSEFEYEMEEEDIEAVIEAIDLIEQEMSDGKYILDKEVSFDLSTLYPGLYGTADIVLRSSDMKTLKVFDYKHGKGVPVEVYMNKQLLYYALGAVNWTAQKEGLELNLYGWGGVFERVELGVIQPRCRHKDGPLRKMEVTPKILDAFAIDLMVSAQATADPKAPLSAGDHCRWCPALSICGQIEKRTQELAEVDFTPISSPDNLHLPEPGEMSTEKISKILNFSEVITNWLTQVRGYALERLQMGQEVPGYKLVAKKANRRWKDEDEASTFLQQTWEEDELYDYEFKSPAKIEKMLGKHKGDIEHLWYKPEVGNTMAPEHDKRSAISAGPGQDFERIER